MRRWQARGRDSLVADAVSSALHGNDDDDDDPPSAVLDGAGARIGLDTSGWRDVFPSDEQLDALLDELYPAGGRVGPSRSTNPMRRQPPTAAPTSSRPQSDPLTSPCSRIYSRLQTPPAPVGSSTSSGNRSDFGFRSEKELSPTCTQRSKGSQNGKLLVPRPGFSFGNFRRGPPADTLRPPSSTPSWRPRRPWSVGSWSTRSRGEWACSAPIERIPDDALETILSYMWPPRLLGSVRLATRRMWRAVEALRLDCSLCGVPCGWRVALLCDGCQTVRCRPCAGIEVAPLTLSCCRKDRCRSCGGHVQSEWLSCPWCGTRKKRQSSLRRPARLEHARGAWSVHSCGHEMHPRRMCECCTLMCCLCGCGGCRDCTWHDGNRVACFGCTVLYGR